MIVVRARAQNHEIRLGLVIGVEAQRALNVDQRGLVVQGAGKKPGQPVGDGGVGAADGGHVDDVSIDQLDAMAIREDAGLGHPVIGPNVEPMAGWRKGTLENLGHGFSPGGSLRPAEPDANA